MFFQKSRQIAAGQVGDGAELQVQHVVIRPIAFDPRLEAQIGDLSQREAAFRSDQVQINRVEFFGLHGRPGFFLLGHVDRHHLLVVPKDLAVGCGGGQQFDQFFQHLFVPENFFADGKTLAGEMPLAAELFPGLQDVGLFLDAFGEPAEAGHRAIDEVPKLRAIDLLVTVHAQFDFLPRSAEVSAFHPRLGAVERQVGHVVQRLQIEFLDQFLLLEGVPRGAELHLQQPLLAGDGVEEPAVRFLLPADLDHRSRVPIGFAEQFGLLLDAVDHLGQDAAVPAAGIAGAAHAIDRVPVPAVDFPGHSGVAADLGDVAVAGLFGQFGGEVEYLPLRRTARPPASGPALRRCRNEERCGRTGEAVPGDDC